MVKIVEKNIKKGYIKVLVEDTDDLWLLYNIIHERDVVKARTTRDVKREGSGSRRIPMTLAVQVTGLEFQAFTSRLRVRGIVVEGPERFGVKGHYHTINVEPGTVITIYKESWPQYLLEKLEETTKRKGNILLVSIDYDEYSIGVLTHQGLHVLVESSSRISSIDPEKYDSLLERYKESVAKQVVEYAIKYRASAILIASPGFLKNDIKRLILDRIKTASIPIYTDTISVGGTSGLHELLRRDSIKKIMRELEVVRAAEIYDEFMHKIVKEPDYVAYGIDEVKTAVKNNAVDKLAVAESLLKTVDENTRRKVEEILKEADRRRAKIYFAPSNTDVEKQLLGVGGIIAILRFPMPRLREDKGNT